MYSLNIEYLFRYSAICIFPVSLSSLYWLFNRKNLPKIIHRFPPAERRRKKGRCSEIAPFAEMDGSLLRLCGFVGSSFNENKAKQIYLNTKSDTKLSKLVNGGSSRCCSTRGNPPLHFVCVCMYVCRRVYLCIRTSVRSIPSSLFLYFEK